MLCKYIHTSLLLLATSYAQAVVVIMYVGSACWIRALLDESAVRLCNGLLVLGHFRGRPANIIQYSFFG